MFNIKDLKRNITHILSSAIGATTKTLLSLPFFPTNSILLYILTQLFHAIFLCSTHSLPSTWHHLQSLTQRSNQFSLKIDSCWYGSDCVPYVIHFSHFLQCSNPVFKKSDTCWSFHSVPTAINVIRVGQINFVPTTTIVIRVGKNIFSFQPLKE